MNSRLESKLEKFQQTHLLRFWDELDQQQRESLESQIASIDFELLSRLFKSDEDANRWEELAARAEVPPAITLEDFANPDSYNAAEEVGSQAISQGKVGMVLVAGGQGSRLGFHHPKGMFEIGPISNRSLYQMHIEQLRARARQFSSRIPLYVMTSPPTHDETTRFLKAKQNFGLPKDDLNIFCQGTMPAVDLDGKLLLQQKDKIFVSPDGHGGTLAALEKSGCLADMQKRGIEYLFYGQVDNPLIQICNPALIGYHIDRRSEMTSQVVRKSDPLQKVGNVVRVGDQVCIIEYSDLPEKYARQTRTDGSLKLWAGSIAVHIFDTEFLTRASQQPDSLPYHRAHKKVPFIDSSGNRVQPSEPNAIKFERFIFDLLPSAANSIVCEVDAADGFCAVKNASPADSETPEHVRQAIVDLHSNWLTQAGAYVEPGTPVEINPLYAVDAEQLRQVLPTGTSITEATYLSEAD